MPINGMAETKMLFKVLCLGVVFSIIAPVEIWAKLRPPLDSGCFSKNYGCFCPAGQRKIPDKCSKMFDEEITQPTSGFPVPIKISQPNLSPYLSTIDLSSSQICKIDKFCESKLLLFNE